eukprot:TRINITY_DN5305_c1_g4_i2.p1 TRINITY_DN5305_c1_g4~~TRINITY_DN5305_c1_g4_i2.p1  ORF type:complete len:914 (+),score=247.13 TRINITY_DN5305_c1_g4_i2:98-2839(+)
MPPSPHEISGLSLAASQKRVQHRVDKGGGLVGPVALGQLHRLVDGHLGRHRLHGEEHLIAGQAQDVAVHPVHALHPPAPAGRGQGLVDVCRRAADAHDQHAGVVPQPGRGGEVVGKAVQRVLGRGVAVLHLIEHLEGQLAAFAAFAHGQASRSYRFLSRSTISMAARAASEPLLPALVPARSMACSMVSVVNTPKITGTPVSRLTWATPLETSAATQSKWLVAPRITAPRVSTASYLPLAASLRATRGISKDPGTHTTVRFCSAAPWRFRASRAPSTSLLVMKSLKRPATRANRIPLALRVPSIILAISPPIGHAGLFKQVPHLVALGAQVGFVFGAGGYLQRHPLHHRKAVALQSHHLLGVIGHQAHLADPQVGQDLRPDSIVAHVGREAQALVGLHGVGPSVLQLIGLELVHQADAPALLAHVQEHSAALVVDHLEGLGKLVAAVAAPGVKHVAGQALGVHPDQHRLFGVDLSLDQGHVLQVVHVIGVAVGMELAELGGQAHLGLAVHKGLVAHAVGDQVGDGHDLQIVLGRELLQVGHAGHGAVVLHDLADHPGRGQAGQAGQVHRALGLAGAHQHPAPAGPQRKDVPRAHQVGRARGGVHRGADGVGPVLGADAGGHPVAGLHRHGEGGLKGRLVVAHHQGQAQALHVVRGQAQADEAAAVLGHEVDGLGSAQVRGHGQVALVLPVLVVDQDHHLAVAYVFDGLIYAGQRHGVSPICSTRAGLICAHFRPGAQSSSTSFCSFISPPHWSTACSSSRTKPTSSQSLRAASSPAKVHRNRRRCPTARAKDKSMASRSRPRPTPCMAGSTMNQRTRAPSANSPSRATAPARPSGPRAARKKSRAGLKRAKNSASSRPTWDSKDKSKPQLSAQQVACRRVTSPITPGQQPVNSTPCTVPAPGGGSPPATSPCA